MPSRILIIEDNPANLELMAYLLRAAGHGVVTAVDGEAGVQALRQEKPDLIVCDVRMPVLNGYEVARMLKADPELRDIPLIAVTASARDQDRDSVLAAGFDGYMTKPIHPESFATEIEEYLPDHD